MGQMVGFFFEREEFLVFESAIAKDRQSFQGKKNWEQLSSGAAWKEQWRAGGRSSGT